ncbi:MAG TPA: hypothetical protein VFE33_11325 [Thermoanaerobaculia bacterium]|nr:hypothetical protein [Thermoanaerobaculia bacterium]
MTPGRLLLVGLGLLIAAGAVVLVARGWSGMSSGSGVGGAADPQNAGTPPPGGGHGDDKEKEKAAPRWQSFTRPDVAGVAGVADPHNPAVPRPVLHFAAPVASPFHSAPTASAVAPREAPHLRLDGVSPGEHGVALLSGKVVRLGETISGYRLSRIGKSSVSLVNPAGARLELVLGASPPPPPSAARVPAPAPRPYARLAPPPERPSPDRPPGGGGG